MTARKLTLPEMAESGFTHSIRITYLDLINLSPPPGLTKVLQVFPETGTAPAGTYFRYPVGLRVHTGFLGGAMSACTVQLGDGSIPNRLMIATTVYDPPSFAYMVGLNNVATAPFVFDNTPDSLDVLFTAVGANLSALVQGDIEFFISTGNLAALDSAT